MCCSGLGAATYCFRKEQDPEKKGEYRTAPIWPKDLVSIPISVAHGHGLPEDEEWQNHRWSTFRTEAVIRGAKTNVKIVIGSDSRRAMLAALGWSPAAWPFSKNDAAKFIADTFRKAVSLEHDGEKAGYDGKSPLLIGDLEFFEPNTGQPCWFRPIPDSKVGGILLSR